MGNDDIEYGKLIGNLFIMILIITSVIIILPTLSYIYNIITGNAIDIEMYNIESEDDAKFNTLNEIYLFCSYIPFRRAKVCNNKDDPENDKYKEHQDRISQIISIISNIKTRSKEFGEKLKETAIKDIKDEVDKRQVREQEDKIMAQKNAIENMKESGENVRFGSKMFLEWSKVVIGILGSFLNNLGTIIYKATDITFKFADLIKPILAALAGNKVVMGFIILVFVIFLILGYLKVKDDANKRKELTSNLGGTGSAGGFSFSSIYEEIMDTLNYYNDLIKNFKLSDMTGGLLQNEENKDNEEDNGLLISRKTIDGKSYDNLSYIMLSDVFSDNDITKAEYFGKDVKIERDKYYNIYLPEEKFKDTMSSIKWKVSNAERKNERIWRIDCESIDTIKRDGKDTKTPAFITSKATCIINDNGLDEANKPREEFLKDIPYKTEYIK